MATFMDIPLSDRDKANHPLLYSTESRLRVSLARAATAAFPICSRRDGWR